MSFLSDAEKTSDNKYIVRCPVALLLADNPELGGEVIEAIEAKTDGGNYSVTGTAIADQLLTRGVTIIPSAIRRHRSGACACKWRNR